MKSAVCNFDMTQHEDYSFSVTFNPITQPVMNWKEEVYRSARLISTMTDRPIYVCMSGGIDSEVAALAFLEQGIPFTAITLRHIQHTNDHEVAYVIDWCHRHKVPLKFIPIDLTDFFVRKIDTYIEQGYLGGTISYSIYTYMYMMEIIHELGGSAVMGMGEPVIRNINGEMRMEVIPYRHTLLRYMERNSDQLHFPWFFLLTPEILASYFQEPLVKMFVDDPSYYASQIPDGIQSLEKAIVYHRYFPDMYRRHKGTGWEYFRRTLPTMSSWIGARHRKYKDTPENKAIDNHFWLPIADVRSQLGI